MTERKHIKQLRVALGTFLISGMLALLLIASLEYEWGTAYGQTAGPTPTSATTTGPATETTIPSIVGSKSKSGLPTSSSVVPGENKNLTKVDGEALMPGLPRTGQLQDYNRNSQANFIQVLALISLTGLCLASSLVLIRLKRTASKSKAQKF